MVPEEEASKLFAQLCDMDEEAATLPAETGYTNAVHGGGILLLPPRRMQPFLKEQLMWENCQSKTAT